MDDPKVPFSFETSVSFANWRGITSQNTWIFEWNDIYNYVVSIYEKAKWKK